MGLVNTADCTAPVPETCDGLWQEGNGILTAALAGLEPFIPDGDCDTLEAFTSHNAPTAPLIEGNDRLSVNLVKYGPAAVRGNADPSVLANGGGLALFEVNWRVELWLQGYPHMAGDRAPRMPDTTKITGITRQLDALGAAVYQAVLTARADGTILAGCMASTVTDLLPLGPSAGLAGWGFNVVTRS